MIYTIGGFFIIFVGLSLFFWYEQLCLLKDISDALDDLVSLGIEKNEIECKNMKNGRWTDEPYIGNVR